MLVAVLRPPVFTASRKSGKMTLGMTAAGCRISRTTDRPAIAPTWIGSGEPATAALLTVPGPRPPTAIVSPGETSTSISPSPAPSRWWPVLARKTSSRVGSLSTRLASSIPAESKARTTPTRSSESSSRRTSIAPVPSSSRSPKESSSLAASSRREPSCGQTSTLGRPISDLSAAGVPSAAIFPSSMIPTRSASWSASSRYWVVRKTVTPSSRESRVTSSQSAERL